MSVKVYGEIPCYRSTACSLTLEKMSFCVNALLVTEELLTLSSQSNPQAGMICSSQE